MHNTTNTREGLNAGRSLIDARIRELIEAEGGLALKAAEGDVEARSQLAANQSEGLRLRNERRTSEAALAELAKRDRKDSLQASLRSIKADRAGAHASVRAVRPAYDRVTLAFSELELAWPALQDALAEARRAERSQVGLSHNDVVSGGRASLHRTAINVVVTALVQGCLWSAVGPLEANREMAKAHPESLDAEIERSINRIDEALVRHEKAIREQLSDSEEAA